MQKQNNDMDKNLTKIKVGICAMKKKVQSRPMREILKRLKQFTIFQFVIFEEKQILEEPVEDWPIIDCFIAFFSSGFPLSKAMKYTELRKPFVLNDLGIQDMLQDRREVYQKLVENGIDTPRHVIFNRNEDNKPLDGCEEIEEHDDVINVKGFIFKKPFVEKPIDAEDHNVYIYYPSSAGGGCQILFRKVGNKSSVYSSKSSIRRNGSFIYEDFMPTDGTDVKVYTIGDEYAHAEARKAPVLDGKVDRDKSGKELRYPVILNSEEKLIAQKISQSFKQTVCGFDLLRANGKSFVCDVNGFSFVKTSKKYYDDCAQLLADIILKTLAPQTMSTLNQSVISSQDNTTTKIENGKRYQLRSVVAIMRHGDRTPKQKMKMLVTHRLFFELFVKYGGEKEGRLKIKKPKHMQDILHVVRTLVDGYDNDTTLHPIEESKAKLLQMKNVLEMYGTFNGINRKVQFKAMYDKRNAEMFAKLKGRNNRDSFTSSACDSKALLVIVKWGGELTPFGKKQAEELGRAFRCVYSYEDSHNRVPGCGLLRLHSSYRHDLKIYASDEGRVQMTAAAFAKGLLELEGELTPILVSLVKSNNYSTGMLDTPAGVDGMMSKVKSKLHEFLRSEKDFSTKDIETLSPVNDSAVRKAIDQVSNPKEMCIKVYDLIDNLVQQIEELCKEDETRKLYYEESLNLMDHRWQKLKKDFYNGSEFDISLIPDIYDCVRYDYIHNDQLGLKNLPELYQYAKLLADIVIPQEYGIASNEKLEISQQIAGKFFKKLQVDLNSNTNCQHDNNHNENTITLTNDNIRTRLYITSESHIHSVVNALRCGSLCKNISDKQWEISLAHLFNTSELNYLTQVVFIEYEDMTVPPTSEERWKISLYFSPGVKSPTTPQLVQDLQDLSLGNSMDYVFKSNNDLDDVRLAAETQAREREAEIKLRSTEEMTIIDEVLTNGSNGIIKSAVTPKKITLSKHKQRSVDNPPTILSMKPATEGQVINILEADIIETIPSLYPLVSLHSSITLKQMDSFLDEVKEKDDCSR